MPESQPTDSRSSLIGAVKTYLGFFVLLALIMESVLGAVALKTVGQTQWLAVSGMLGVLVLLVLLVGAFAYFKPHALLQDAQQVSQPAANTPLQDFCARLEGYWWENIKQDEVSALSFLEIRADPSSGTVKLQGKAYDKQGQLAANWESVASCVNLPDRKLFYYWRGLHPSRPNEPYEGFGELSLESVDGRIDKGSGFFFDCKVTEMALTTRKSFTLQRASKKECTIMHGDDAEAVTALVRQQLA